jgi:hypothetical protein
MRSRAMERIRQVNASLAPMYERPGAVIWGYDHGSPDVTVPRL